MKNLAQFKRRLADTLAKGGTVDFHLKGVTLYGVDHPARLHHPEGQVHEVYDKARKIGRVQSQAFTRITEKGTESWLYFGSAAEWNFPDENTAVCTGGSYKGHGHDHVQTLSYRFNP